jgi:hypothetical protein
MSKRHILALASAGALALSLASSASAANAYFCRDYAGAALRQVRGAMNHPACMSQLQGARWSADWHVHFDWCRGVDRDQAVSERQARREMLAGCSR